MSRDEGRAYSEIMRRRYAAVRTKKGRWQKAGKQDLDRVTAERDTLKGQETSVTAERDAAVKERDAFKAEVDRLAKLVGKTSTPPAGVRSYRLHVIGYRLLVTRYRLNNSSRQQPPTCNM